MELADDPSKPVEEALDLIDELLETAQDTSFERAFAPVAEGLVQVTRELGYDVEVSYDLTAALPLPPGPLRVILRNLLSNAVAAGARHVHVSAERSPFSLRLLVDDDGVGLAEVDRYESGSGLGLTLSRRIAGRFGGVLELTPLTAGGTRAVLTFAEALA